MRGLDLHRLCPLLLVLLLALALVSPGVACQVPVFRYALERWAPATYPVVIVPGSAGLSEAEEAALQQLQAAPLAKPQPANIELEVGAADAGNSGSASIQLSYPPKRNEAGPHPIWQAPLSPESVQVLLDSPARGELRARLLEGQSAIWVLVESGEKAKDDAAAAILSDALAEAAATLKLPEGAVSPAGGAKESADILRADLPLRIEFSILRVRRNDPAEAAFLAMLTSLEEDLAEYAHEPMVFPVFGRARVLEPLIGAGIHKANVLEHAGYLCGACSCEVKDQNPGMDLLMSANWEPVDTTPTMEVVRIAPGGESRADAPRRVPFLAVGAGALLLGAVAWGASRRGPRVG